MEQLSTVKIPAAKQDKSKQKSWLMRFFKENGLSLVMFGFFLLFLLGQTLTGWADYNSEQQDHRQAEIGLVEYLGSGHYIEAVFENWESEFLQMGMFILLTVWLRQKGSAESKKIDGTESVDEDPAKHRNDPQAPWPVRQGGIALLLYKNSLSIAFFGLFLLSFILHAVGGRQEYCEEQLQHGAKCPSFFEFLGSSRFWFESFQNWQSEFLSIGLMVALTVMLRQYGSPESKPVHTPNHETGRD